MDKNKVSFWRRLIKRKRFWALIIIALAIVGYFVFKPNANLANIVTDTVKYVDLKQTVLATGQVTSKTDLSLSFNGSGVVKSVRVKVGDNVKKDQILANLEQSSELAALTSARGALAAANARLKRTIEGYSNEEISLSQIALDNAKRDYGNVKNAQETLVKNNYNNLLNSTPEAVPANVTSDYVSPTISGNYNLDKEGNININIYRTSSGASFSVSGIVDGNGIVTATTPQPIGNSGLYIKFPSTNPTISDWIISIPNKKAANYLINLNAYESALKSEQSMLSSAQSLIDQRQAELVIKNAKPRDSDVELARADILSAEGQMQAAQARYENTIIRSPADGTITKVDIKIGELSQVQKEVMILQDISNIYLEANINEANITSLNVGMPIDVNFDAFGPDMIFKGTITEIDPSSTLISGVVNYKVTASVEQVKDLRPGMTANMTIKAKEKNHVLVVPMRAILVDKSDNRTIRLITDTKNKTYKEVPIVTGLEGDSGMAEVVSGLKEGDEFVVLIKK